MLSLVLVKSKFNGVEWSGLEQNRVNRFQFLYMESMKIFTTVPPRSVAEGKISWDTGLVGAVLSAGVVLYLSIVEYFLVPFCRHSMIFIRRATSVEEGSNLKRRQHSTRRNSSSTSYFSSWNVV